MPLLLSRPGSVVDDVTRHADQIVVVAHHRRHHAACPRCGPRSATVHSRHERRPADLPSLGTAGQVLLRARRFYGRHPPCPRQTFAETFPTLLVPKPRRTRRLTQALGRIALSMGAEPGSRLLPHLALLHLAMPASPDTLLRLVRGLPLPPSGPGRGSSKPDRQRRAPAVFARSGPSQRGSSRTDRPCGLP